MIDLCSESLDSLDSHISGSTLSSLSAFIKACRRILHFILAAPPFGSGNQSRAEELLRLTDFQDSIIGYDLSTTQARQSLFEWLDILVSAHPSLEFYQLLRKDRGWETVLLGKSWPTTNQDISNG